MNYLDVIAAAKALTDQTASDQGGTQAEHIIWLRSLYPAMVRRVADVLPDRYTVQEIAELTVGDPTDPVGNYNKIRKVERLVGETYVKVRPLDYNLGDTGQVMWRQIGGNLEIFPAGTTGTFRLEYIPPYPLPAPDVELELPPGVEFCLVHELAKMIRIRMDQSYAAHDQEYQRIWAEIISSFVPVSSEPQGISDYEVDSDQGPYWQ